MISTNVVEGVVLHHAGTWARVQCATDAGGAPDRKAFVKRSA
jgi:hypothetical protein